MIISAETDKVFAAFVAAQAQMPAVKRTKTVKVKTRTGNNYTFKYAPLDEVIDTVKQVYAEHKLSVTQILDGDNIVTLVTHASGQYFGGEVNIGKYLTKTVDTVIDGQKTKIEEPVSAQEAGSAYTYFKRYAYGSINNLALEDDDDGNLASGNDAEEVGPPRSTPPKPAAKPPTKKPDPKPAAKAPKEEEKAIEPEVSEEAPWDEEWDEVYETKLKETLSKYDSVQSMMEFVQTTMKQIQSSQGAAKKAEWRAKFQPLVTEIASAKAN